MGGDGKGRHRFLKRQKYEYFEEPNESEEDSILGYQLKLTAEGVILKKRDLRLHKDPEELKNYAEGFKNAKRHTSS